MDQESTPRHRRTSDQPDEDWRDHRADPMELRLGYRGASVRARGLTVVMVLMAALIAGSNLYAAWRLELAVQGRLSRQQEIATAEHIAMTNMLVRLRVAQDRTSCIITFSQADREKFRDRYSIGAFHQWCPWTED